MTAPRTVLTLIASLVLAWQVPARGADATLTRPPVKLSSSGICHDSSSPSYEQTKHFTSYPTIEACLKAGGRLPKSQASTSSEPGSQPIVKKSKSGICHDATSAYYSRTTHFTPYSTMAACLASGGRLPN